MEGKETSGNFRLLFGFFVIAILSDLASSAIKGYYSKFKKAQITDTDKLAAMKTYYLTKDYTVGGLNMSMGGSVKGLVNGNSLFVEGDKNVSIPMNILSTDVVKTNFEFESVEVPESIKSTWDKIKGLEGKAKNKLFTKFAEAKIKQAV